MAAWASASMGGAVEYKDPLDVAVAPLDDVAALQRTNRLILYAGDTFSYDNNIYRLPASVTDLATLPGIVRTTTHLAMRSYGRGEIAAAYDIGLD